MELIWLRSIPAAFMLAGRCVAFACHWPTPEPASTMICLSPILSTITVSGIGMNSVEARIGERGLRFFDRGILDESGIVRFAPDPIIYGRDLDGPDLVLVEAGRRFKRCVRMNRANKVQLLVQPKGCSRGCSHGGRCQETPARHG